MQLFLSNLDFLPNREDIVNSLIPNWLTIVSHILATAVILLIVIKLLWKPFKKSLAARQNVIAQEINLAKEMNLEATSLKEKSELKIKLANSESERILEAARVDSYRLREELENEARQYSSRIRNDANEELKKLERNLRQDIKKEITDIAFLAANQLLKRKLSDKEDQDLIDDLLVDIQNSKESV